MHYILQVHVAMYSYIAKQNFSLQILTDAQEQGIKLPQLMLNQTLPLCSTHMQALA